MTAIETKGLTKYYGKNRGIEGISISVSEGEIYGFIGPNGAGKSTMIRLLLGFLFPTSGSAKLLGMDCVRDSHLIKRKVCYVPAEVNFYKDLTIAQMLVYSDSFYENADREYTTQLIEKFCLEPNKKMGSLSSGNKKKAALVAALSPRPRLLILDEPTSGLDPLMRSVLFEVLQESHEKGASVFLSSHNLDEVQSLCSRAAIIREGQIVDVRDVHGLKQVRKVTLRGANMPDVKGEAITPVSRSRGEAVFTYTGDMKKLAMMIAGMDLHDFLVEDVNISDVFMSYYR